MSLELPSYMTIPKGDFKGIFDGYFLVTDTYASRPIVGSTILKEIQTIVDKITVYHTDNTYTDYVRNWLKGYGVDPDTFAAYLEANKGKIAYAVGDYQVIQDWVEEYKNYYKILAGHSVSEFIDYVASKAKSATQGVVNGIIDIFVQALLKLMPVIIIAIVLFMVFTYGMSNLNKSKK